MNKVFLEKEENYSMGFLDGLMERNLTEKTRNKNPYFYPKTVLSKQAPHEAAEALE